MAVSRSFILYMNADQKNNATVPWTVVGSDAGLSLKPVQTNTLTISIAERWEVVVDFAQYAGQNVTVKNQRDVGVDDDFVGTDRLMSKLSQSLLQLLEDRL
jgi:bilirubin oxidase